MARAALSELQAALEALDAREGAEAGATDNSDVLRFQAAAHSLCTALNAYETEDLSAVETLFQGLDSLSNETSTREAGAPNPFTLLTAFQYDIMDRTEKALRQREPEPSLQPFPLDHQPTQMLPRPPAAGYQGMVTLPPNAQLLCFKNEHGLKMPPDDELLHSATAFKIWLPGNSIDSPEIEWYEAKHIRPEQLQQMLSRNRQTRALEQERQAAERSSQPDASVYDRAARYCPHTAFARLEEHTNATALI